MFLKEAFLPHCATERQSLRISKACRKLGKFQENHYIIKEPIYEKKTFTEEVLDMQNGILTNRHKKNSPNVPNVLAQIKCNFFSEKTIVPLNIPNVQE